MERRQHRLGAGDFDVLAAQQRPIKRVALALEILDAADRITGIGQQVPGAQVLAQEVFLEGFACELDAMRRHGLAGGFEIETFGVDQHAVVVEKNATDHSKRG